MTPFKQKLRSRQPASLINADHASAGLVAFVARLGIDAVMLDCEQGNPSFENVEDMTRAARLAGISSIVRVPSAEPWTIERYVMRGIDGLVIPRLDTAAQVARAVADMRYAAPKDFDRQALIVQVESAQALSELDGFLAIDEIDCFFIGAVDLAKSLGHAGDYHQPAVMEAMFDTLARIEKTGRAAGFLVKENDIAFWQARGATMLYAHVNDFLMMGARQWRAIAGMGDRA